MGYRYLFPFFFLLASGTYAQVTATPQRQTGLGMITSGTFQIVDGQLRTSMQVEGTIAVMDQEGDHTVLHSGATKAEVEKAANDAGVLIVAITPDEWRVGQTTIRFENDRFTTVLDPDGSNHDDRGNLQPVNLPRNSFADSLYRSIFLDACTAHAEPAREKRVDTLVVFNNDRIISVGDFLLLYGKVHSTYRKDSVSDYLDLVINYKVKVFDAERSGMDTTRAFRNEMEQYALGLAEGRMEKDPFITKDSLRRSTGVIADLAMQYRDGILLFAATDENVWGKAIHDEPSLTKFYEDHRSNYTGDMNSQRGLIVADYQIHLEDNWVRTLRETYAPLINERSFGGLIKE